MEGRESHRKGGIGMGARSEQPGRNVSRRELLNYAWLASLGFLLVDLGGMGYLFARPRFRKGEFGGQFELGRARDVFPPPGGDPIRKPKGRFWLCRTEEGLVVALYRVCTHLGCLYGWRSEEHKFICPCHGTQYQLDGTYIRGPAPRSADRFVIRLLDDQGNEVAATDEQGNPLELPDEDLLVVVDTGRLIRGKPRGVRYPVPT
ncbi:MAG TPA: Rieske 2Fe-2S domain-containing protein [Caldilineae bacterium]|nr:Rieske 2Fe-2S domain-containing protein [Caldilineae bacterium]